jgi:histidine kinase
MARYLSFPAVEKLMKFLNLLAFRVFLIILFVMLVGTAVLTKLSIDRQAEQYLRDAIVGANRIGDVIKRSTNYSMMLNRQEDIHQIISTIGNEPGLEAIRIYDKKGEIRLSTVAGEVGTYVNMNAEACNACHSAGKTPLSPTQHVRPQIVMLMHRRRPSLECSTS